MTDTPAWPQKLNDSLKIEDDKMWHYNHGFNAAIDQCNECVENLTEKEILKLIKENGLFCPGIQIDQDYAEELAAGIVRHIKWRLS